MSNPHKTGTNSVVIKNAILIIYLILVTEDDVVVNSLNASSSVTYEI